MNAATPVAEASWPASIIRARSRVVIDNDFAGDPDGLVQLAHHLLCRSVDIPLVIGSHLREGDPWNRTDDSADRADRLAREIAALTGRADVRTIAGSNTPMRDPSTPIRSDAAVALIAEAMRTDTELPLFVACGAGLTEVASAWLIEPRIAERITLVWIGGHEHDGLAEPPPGAPDMEYNLHIDSIAGQVVFNDSDIDIWQVPRDAYRSVLASRAEMLVRMRSQGLLGRHLFDSLAAVVTMFADEVATGETYALGDSPLVLLTALLTTFEPSPASSSYVTVPCPQILPSGLYESRPGGRPLRVYTRLDNRLLLEDLYAKLQLHAAGDS